jgi:hypothetical protein
MLQLHGVDENEDVDVRRQCRQAPDEAVPGSTPARGTKNDEAPAPGMMPALTRSHRACRKIDGDREDAAQRQGPHARWRVERPFQRGITRVTEYAARRDKLVSEGILEMHECSCMFLF